MKRPKIVVKRLEPLAGWYYFIYAKNGRKLAVSNQGYEFQSDAIRGAKDLIKTCLIMFNERKVRVFDANGKKINIENSPS